jgi:hypothetical protein
MKKTAMYFTHVAAAIRPGAAILCGHMIDQESDPTFTRFSQAYDENDWAHIGDLRGDIVYAVTSTASQKVAGKTDFYALGRGGTLRVMLAGQPDKDISIPIKDKSSYLESMCLTPNGLYVCGGQKEVLCYENGVWKNVDENLYEKFNGKNESTLFAITEVHPGTLLAVGTGGFVARRYAPTNVDLHAVIPTGDGGAWIAGSGGALFRLVVSKGTWEDHSDATVSTNTFDSLALHRNVLYISAFTQLLQLQPGSKLKEIEGPFKKDSEFHSISAAGDFLWVTGDEHVYRLGPEGWRHFLCPDNV